MTDTTAPTSRPSSRWVAILIVALVVWVTTLLAGIIAVIATAGGPGRYAADWDEEHVRGAGDKVVLIEVSGEIVPGQGSSSPFGPSFLGADDYVSQLRQASADDSVRAVIVRLNTPGGAVVASDQVYRAVRELAQEKPVVALMGDVAASGGYYIAAAANEIVAHPATITGSIGVIAFFPNLEGTAEKLGVEPVVITSGRFKDMGSPFHEMTAAERRILQRLIDEAYDGFVDAVADGRSMSAARVRQLADGRIYSGRQAESNGLIDHLGDLPEAIERVRDLGSLGADVELVRYVPPPLGFGDLFARVPGVGRSLGDELRDAGREAAGLPRVPGMHYLWLRG